MKASDYIAAFLAEQGVTHRLRDDRRDDHAPARFAAPRDDIEIVSMHHEQAAAFAAEAGARMTGVPGVALATSGPGATNLHHRASGAASSTRCLLSSSPARSTRTSCAGTAGCARPVSRRPTSWRSPQPITKAAWQVTRRCSCRRRCSPRPSARALRARPGPVLLDIPMDVQRQEIDDRRWRRVVRPLEARRPQTVSRGAGRARERQSGRSSWPAAAFARAGAADILQGVRRGVGVPVASIAHGPRRTRHRSPAARGHDRYLRQPLGEPRAEGRRLRARPGRASRCAPDRGRMATRSSAGKTLITGRRRCSSSSVARACRHRRCRRTSGAFSSGPLRASSLLAWPDRATWLRSHRRATRATVPDEAELADRRGINPAEAMHGCRPAAGDASAFVTDVGQNQMWAAQSLRLGEGQRFLTSAAWAPWGSRSPPRSVRPSLHPASRSSRLPATAVTQVNIQELETVARLGLPLKIVVLNNGCLGMVRQFQDELFESRFQSTVWGYGAPDFVAVAGAYGIAAQRVEQPLDLEASLDWLMSNPATPALLKIKLIGGRASAPRSRTETLCT